MSASASGRCTLPGHCRNGSGTLHQGCRWPQNAMIAARAHALCGATCRPLLGAAASDWLPPAAPPVCPACSMQAPVHPSTASSPVLGRATSSKKCLLLACFAAVATIALGVGLGVGLSGSDSSTSTSSGGGGSSGNGGGSSEATTATVYGATLSSECQEMATSALPGLPGAPGLPCRLLWPLPVAPATLPPAHSCLRMPLQLLQSTTGKWWTSQSTT